MINEVVSPPRFFYILEINYVKGKKSIYINCNRFIIGHIRLFESTANRRSTTDR